MATKAVGLAFQEALVDGQLSSKTVPRDCPHSWRQRSDSPGFPAGEMIAPIGTEVHTEKCEKRTTCTVRSAQISLEEPYSHVYMLHTEILPTIFLQLLVTRDI
jgi:hypothetical protein